MNLARNVDAIGSAAGIRHTAALPVIREPRGASAVSTIIETRAQSIRIYKIDAVDIRGNRKSIGSASQSTTSDDVSSTAVTRPVLKVLRRCRGDETKKGQGRGFHDGRVYV